MAYDFSQVTDAQLETAMTALLNDPAARFATPVAQRQATVAEYNRRRAARQPANVTGNLEASATPIAVEPMAGTPAQEDVDEALGFPTKHRAAADMAVPGGGLGVRNTPEDLAVYGQVVRDAYGRIIDRGVARRQEARAQGYQDPEQLAYNAETGLLPPSMPRGDTVMVDGVEVPIHRNSIGQPMYDSQGRPMTTIGAEREAKDAAAEAAWLARFRANQDADRQKYGDWRGRTPEQADAYAARNAAIERSAESAATARDRPGLQQLEKDAKKRRELIATRAMLAGGSSGLRGGPGGNMGMFTALAMLGGVDPENMDAQQQAMMQMLPINPDRAKIDAAVLDRAAGLAARGIQGALAGNVENGAAAGVFKQKNRDNARADFDRWWDRALGTNPGAARSYTWDQHNNMVNFLMNQYDLSLPEAKAIAQSRGMPAGPRSGGAAPPPSVPSVGFPVENEPGGMGTPM